MLNNQYKKILENAKRVFMDAEFFKEDELIFYYQVCELIYKEEGLKEAKLLASKVSAYWDFQLGVIKNEIHALILDRNGDKSSLNELMQELYRSKAQIDRDAIQFILGFKKYSSSKDHIREYSASLKSKAHKLKEVAEALEEKANFLYYESFEEVEEFELYNSLNTAGIKPRAKNTLKKLNIKTFSDFYNITKKEILNVEGAGKKTANNILDIQRALKKIIIT